MFHILIVEDEKVERETLVQILYDKLKDIKVDAARNGIEALEKANIQQYGLICTDINMPGMNGLAMIKEMKSTQVHTKYLMLTSYNYFEYAQEAIRIGVSDFVLKPYNIAELISIVEEQRRLYEKECIHHTSDGIRSMMERDFLFAILSNKEEIALYSYMKQLDITMHAGFFLILRDGADVQQNEINEFLKNEQFHYIYDYVHGFLVYVIMYDAIFSDMQMQNIVNFLMTSKRCKEVGLGPIVQDVSRLHHSFQLARNHIDSSIPLMEQLVSKQHSETHPNTIQNLCDGVCACFENFCEEALKNQVQKISDYIFANDQRIVETLIDTFYDTLLQSVDIRYPEISFEDVHILSFHRSDHWYQDLPLSLLLNIKKIWYKIKEARMEHTNHFVKEALIYIDQNYANQIVLADVADYLNISPFYISKLLSSTLHKSFTELVNEKRVEVSKSLLKQDDAMKTIARKVGFQGQSYFNKIFKKYTGMTPKVYRFKTKT